MEDAQKFWKSRIVRYENVSPDTLVPNPDNFKVHPQNQRELMEDILDEIGWVQNVIVNINTKHIIDGHMRVAQAIENGEPSVPVTWVDIAESEEPKVIAMFDPVSQLSKQNRDAVLTAVGKIKTDSKRIQDIVDKIAKRSKLPIDRILSHMKDDDDDFDIDMLDNEIRGENYRLFNADCLDIMRSLPDKSIDCIMVDPPYNVTQAEWDEIIPLEEMWNEVLRIAKDDTMMVFFSAQPFTTLLIGSNPKQFKYEIIWIKSVPSGFLNSRIRPMPIHENICVFANGVMWYNPQMSKGKTHQVGGSTSSKIYGKTDIVDSSTTDLYYPTDVVHYDKERSAVAHSSQKPIDLMKYLINTYSNKGETVLDFTMGFGSTGVAAIQCGRKFIGIELNKEFFESAVERIESAVPDASE